MREVYTLCNRLQINIINVFFVQPVIIFIFICRFAAGTKICDLLSYGQTRIKLTTSHYNLDL